MKRLYSTDNDGCNLIMMSRAIDGYRGPTLVLVRDEDKRVFGGYAQQPWRDGGQYLTDSDSFLFRLDSKLAAFHTTGVQKNHLLLSTYGNEKVNPTAPLCVIAARAERDV